MCRVFEARSITVPSVQWANLVVRRQEVYICAYSGTRVWAGGFDGDRRALTTDLTSISVSFQLVANTMERHDSSQD